jgi:hypothetical protein
MDDAEKPWIEEVYADENGLVFVLDLDPIIRQAAQLPLPNNAEELIRDE